MQLELVYVKCPHCGKWYKNTNLMSYSVFGSQECWSDGKCVSNNFCDESFLPFSKCNNCQNFFWFDDCQSIKNYLLSEYNENPDKEKEDLIRDFFAKNPEFDSQKENNLDLNYPPPEYWYNLPLSFTNDLKFLLENNINLNPEREIFLRTKLMQYLNDFVRTKLIRLRNFQPRAFINHWAFYFKNKKLYYKFRLLRKENLQKLSNLLKPDLAYSDVNFQLIEIQRELGNFRESKVLINNTTSLQRKQNKKFIAKSLFRIKIKSKKIFEI